jgi:hypothetical protein
MAFLMRRLAPGRQLSGSRSGACRPLQANEPYSGLFCTLGDAFAGIIADD